MSNYSEIKQPVYKDIDKPGLAIDQQEANKAIQRYAGKAVVIQDEFGRSVPIRINSVSKKIEYYNGSSWQEVN